MKAVRRKKKKTLSFPIRGAASKREAKRMHMASAADSRLTALAVPLAMSLARDSREAESLLRARSEEMLFLGIVRRREQALQELREAQAGARALAVLHESASAPHLSLIHI